jgi:hypothetical protein
MKHLQEMLNSNGAKLTVDGFIGAKTLQAVTAYTKNRFSELNWAYPQKGLIWLRLDDNLTDTFDDAVCLVQNGSVMNVYPCSTTAGDYYIFNPITWAGITGTAIACEQQVKNCHQFMTGGNWLTLWSKQPYFQQVQNLWIYRDGNKERKINRDRKQVGNFGINLHRGWSGLKNWNCSAGCMIVPDAHWVKIVPYFNQSEVIDFNLLECLP